MEMTALYNNKKVFVSSVSKDKKYVLCSYIDEPFKKMFKLEVADLSEISVMLQAELSREGH